MEGWVSAGGFLEPWKPQMRLFERSFHSAYHNIALDEALLLKAEQSNSGEVLRIWELDSPAVILGSGCKHELDVDVDSCEKDGVPILRRSSGGGTVLLGKGCLLFTLILHLESRPGLATIKGSYQAIMGKMVDCLGLPNSSHDGISDLTLGSKKFSGNAQQRKSNYILHHGSILYDFDLGTIQKYLKHPPMEPEYRSGRSHSDFLTNIPLTRIEIKERIKNGWACRETPQNLPIEETEKLVAEKYLLNSWTFRR